MLMNNLTDLKQKRIIISIHKLLKIYSIQKKAKTSFFSKKTTTTTTTKKQNKKTLLKALSPSVTITL